MPKKSALKRVSAEKRNANALEQALDGTPCIIGKLEKSLGNCGFEVNLGNGKLVQGLIRGVFKVGKVNQSSATAVAVGVFVILSQAEGAHKTHEIVGVINRQKDVTALRKMKAIPLSLFEDAAVDDLFDHSEEDDLFEAAPKAVASQSKAQQEDTIDIDDL
jgi:hypothetical protein